MTIWFNMRFDKFQRRTFPRFLVSEFEEFPIPQIDRKLQDQIAVKVKVIQKLIEDDADSSKESLEIDELVMSAFGLTEEEKEAVRKFEF